MSDLLIRNSEAILSRSAKRIAESTASAAEMMDITHNYSFHDCLVCAMGSYGVPLPEEATPDHLKSKRK